MSPQETQSLQAFLNQLIQVRGIAKDPQADAVINNAVAQQPDAAYLLVQRTLLMEQALNTAKTQIATLQRQIQSQALQAAPAGNFFDANAWGNSAPAPTTRPAAPMMAAPAPVYQPASTMQSAAPAASPGFFGGGAGNILGTVAATAAGVAGGAFLFQGIEHLMHPNSGSGLMNQNGMVPSAGTVENTTVNNYYGDDSSSDNSDSSADDIASNDNDTGNDDSSVI
ncbi:DUF2076 family protein [Glaciimonas sp. CA11.2]|uniref:DUF2076 domain-containing protein n=1 Tax=Glaciimonas sp. CA11.2 TaxID=3048601 RepID=UPI002AB55BC6|nr:DUF2076 family protein [Glaciimonas sp. CA11.2]MDY7547023.1 DUF2076 family protein [Glaciimonas sp. CA11.2]MEB0164118.1 DUF2076 family protein [Glaciimonas sp. CA11.2]